MRMKAFNVRGTAMLTMFIFLLSAVMPVGVDVGFKNVVYAVSYGNGSAGDVTITTTKNVSTYTNKNFRNLTIGAGGNLVFDTDATIYVSQTLTVTNGGQITSANGANGYYQYDYGIEGYKLYSATPGKTVTINAANIVISSGASITSGVGGKGYNAYSGSSQKWGSGNGAQGGNIEIYFNSLSINNGSIITGNGGLPGDGYTYGYSSGSGGNSGNIGLHGGTITLQNGAQVITGNGNNGQHAYSVWINDSGGTPSGGNGGSSGNISLDGTSLTVDATSVIKTGLPGTPGAGYPYSGGTSKGASPGAAGVSGNISITGFNSVSIYGQILTGNGGSATYGTSQYYCYGAVGGDAGAITISGASTVLRLYSTGKITGGTGGTGGTTPGGSNIGPGGNGGKGGNITISVYQLILDSGSLIQGGTGGSGGGGCGASISEYCNTKGGDGGVGGAITLYIYANGIITKSNEVNIKTGAGGAGGSFGGKIVRYNEDTVYYYYYGGAGGKGGDAAVYIPANITSLSNHLVELSGGGLGREINYQNTTGGIVKYYYPGAGGATGSMSVTAYGDLALNGSNIFTFAKPGQGNVWTYNTSTRSNNGSSGSLSLTVSGTLAFNANNAIYFDDMVFDGYTATNSSTLSINCNNIVFNTARPIKWSNASGGTLGITTDLRQFPYTHEQMTTFTKDASQTIGSHIYKFTWTNTADLFVDIPQDGFQVSQDVSFALDETVYNRFLKLFANVRRYKSEDGGTNWQEITSGPMTQTWTWNAPATVKGNSRLKIGITPYGFVSGVSEIWLNGVKLNTYWTPTNTNPPAIVSYSYAILDTDVGVPVVSLEVNGGETLTTDKVLTLSVSAVDNVTKPNLLRYTVVHNDNKGTESIPYESISSYGYDLGKYYGGNPPSGFYKITVKAMDEAFNVGVATKTIYYLRPEDVPAVPQPVNTVQGGGSTQGYAVLDKSGVALAGTTREGKMTYSTNKNAVELDMSSSSQPYYQVRVAESDYGSRVYAKSEVKKLNLPPGEGYHLVAVRSLTADKAPGADTEFYVIVDSTPPEISLSVQNNATITTSTAVQLMLSTKDNIYDTGELQYSYDKLAWQYVPADGVLSKTLSGTGLIKITVYVKDPSGNIGEASVNIWRKTGS